MVAAAPERYKRALVGGNPELIGFSTGRDWITKNWFVEVVEVAIGKVKRASQKL